MFLLLFPAMKNARTWHTHAQEYTRVCVCVKTQTRHTHRQRQTDRQTQEDTARKKEFKMSFPIRKENTSPTNKRQRGTRKTYTIH